MTDDKKEKEEDFDCIDEKCRFKINKSAEDKVDDLKKAIRDLGYAVEDTEEGIRISE